MGRKTKHCWSANNAVERWCIIANALDLFHRLGITHTHTHQAARSEVQTLLRCEQCCREVMYVSERYEVC